MAQSLSYFSTKLLLWCKKEQKDGKKDTICEEKFVTLGQISTFNVQ